MPTFTFTDEEVAFLQAAVFRAWEESSTTADAIRAKLDNPQPDPEPAEEPDWHPLVSTNLKRCRFTPATAELEIEFNGASWTYIAVPADVAARLVTADSPGKFFHENIRGHFEGAGTKPHSRGAANDRTSEPTPLEQFQASEDAERRTNPRDEEDRG